MVTGCYYCIEALCSAHFLPTAHSAFRTSRHGGVAVVRNLGAEWREKTLMREGKGGAQLGTPVPCADVNDGPSLSKLISQCCTSE
jgi:hypothetical protein